MATGVAPGDGTTRMARHPSATTVGGAQPQVSVPSLHKPGLSQGLPGDEQPVVVLQVSAPSQNTPLLQIA